MKAVRIHEFGGPEVLRYEDAPEPQPGAGEALVRVHAASINRGDLSIRAGAFGNPGFPLTIGWEVAGTVEALGPGVEGLAPGARVLAYGPWGGYAEKAVFTAANTVPIPDSLGFAEAATIPVVFVSAWYALIERAATQPGETVLVQAAGSGVGMASIQLARHLGARVIATGGSPAKLELARQLGAEHVINYEESDFEADVKRITDGRGADVVVDVVGGEVLAKSLRALAPGGRVIVVGNSSRQSATIDPNLLLANRAVMGMMTGLLREPGKDRGRIEQILALIQQGRLRPVVDRTFPLSQAAEAHRYLEGRSNVGKVALVTG